MKEFLCDSVFFGVAISILAYELGVFLKKKLKLAVFNPLLISIVAVIVFLVAFHIPYESYNEGAKYLSYLLTPATVCLAIPLYEQFELLKQNVAAIFAGLISGVLTSVICVLVLSLLFHFDHAQYVASPEVDHNGDRNGNLGGTWRLCHNHGCGHHYHRYHRKCVSGNDLPCFQN